VLGTRGVLAIMAGFAMTGGIVVHRKGQEQTGLWLLTAGFALASLWSGLSVVWAPDNPSMLPGDSYLVMGTTGVAGTIYYATLAQESASGSR
jgi:hypothetical protein